MHILWQKVTMHSWHLRSENLTLHSLRTKCLHKSFGILYGIWLSSLNVCHLQMFFHQCWLRMFILHLGLQSHTIYPVYWVVFVGPALDTGRLPLCALQFSSSFSFCSLPPFLCSLFLMFSYFFDTKYFRLVMRSPSSISRSNRFPNKFLWLGY